MLSLQSLSTLALALCASGAFALPTLPGVTPITRIAGDTKSNSYIIKLKDGVDKDAFLASLPSIIGTASSPVTQNFNLCNAFAANLPGALAQLVASLTGVELITEDAIVTLDAVQNDATWGLERISRTGPTENQDPRALTYTYKYPDTAGNGVDVYIVDTGINTEHDTFGGRATFGWAAPDYQKVDGNGHGTHCAGTAVGKLHGVAKNAQVVAVKVLSDQGSGSTSDIMAGIDWVIKQSEETKRPSIISMSLGGSANPMFDCAVRAAVDKGIHTTVAAGNSNMNAEGTSPAREPSVITVGAITIANVRASFSNYGPVVDLWAPGQYVTSAWIGSKTAVNTISGTSMATPHVAGIVATYIAQYGNMSPAALTEMIKQDADKSSDTCMESLDKCPIARVPACSS